MPDAGFPSALVAVKNALHTASGWRWLVEADADGTNGYRICDGDQPITYAGNTFAAYPMRLDEIPADSDGSLPQVALVVAAVDDLVPASLAAGNILDRRIRIWRVNVSDLTVAFPCGEWTALDAVVTYNEASFVLGPYPIFDAPFPAVRQLRGRCPKVYGGPDCGYDLTRTGALTSCDYGLDTANGCAAHGADEAAAGVAVRHPARFGGFPGIPKGLRL